MRHFKEILFMGSGEHSSQRSFKLHKRIQEGLSISSGWQQGADIGERAEELVHIVEDVAAAILGQEISIGSDIEYGLPENSHGNHDGKEKQDAARMDLINSVLDGRLNFDHRKILDALTDEELEGELAVRNFQKSYSNR